jgi:hypothetical protein
VKEGVLTDLSEAQQSIETGLDFLIGLESVHPGWFWEVSERDHGDRRIWPQTQYLLYITFKRLSKLDIAERIRSANWFICPTVDRVGYANDRFCVLDNDVGPFYLWDSETSDYFDEVALIGHYRALAGSIGKAVTLAECLFKNWNSDLGVLGMDKGDKEKGLFRVYKTALAGTLFARVGMLEECRLVATTLERLQEKGGGWITDLRPDGVKEGVANAETTCLALICLHCAARGKF